MGSYRPIDRPDAENAPTGPISLQISALDRPAGTDR